jgi:hypothetical protein
VLGGVANPVDVEWAGHVGPHVCQRAQHPAIPPALRASWVACHSAPSLRACSSPTPDETGGSSCDFPMRHGRRVSTVAVSGASPADSCSVGSSGSLRLLTHSAAHPPDCFTSSHGSVDLGCSAGSGSGGTAGANFRSAASGRWGCTWAAENASAGDDGGGADGAVGVGAGGLVGGSGGLHV